ncbi:MAG: hypothetical protein U5N86_11025 [Planctomycetota bacterium]|nr:hypothetical protein [Planctomycetota bacterium]
MAFQNDTMLRRGEYEKILAQEADTFEERGRKCIALMRLGKTAEALAVATDLQPGDPNETVRAQLVRSDVLQAADSFKEALETLSDFHLPSGVDAENLAKYHTRIADLYQMAGQHDHALSHYAKAYSFAETEDDSGLMMRSSEAAVESARALREDARATNFMEVAMKHAETVAQQSEDPQELLSAADNISLFGEPDTAEEVYLKAYGIAENNGWTWDLALIMLGMSRFDEFSMEPDDALDKTREAIRMLSRIDSLPALINATDQLASQLANAGKGEEALEAMQTVIDSAKELGDDYTYLNSLSKATQLCFEIDQVDAALENLKLLLEESAEREIRPPYIVSLLREAYRMAPDAKVARCWAKRTRKPTSTNCKGCSTIPEPEKRIDNLSQNSNISRHATGD